MNTSSAVIAGPQFPTSAPAVDWSRKTLGDGGDDAPRFELPMGKTADAAAAASNGVKPSDGRAAESKTADGGGRDVQTPPARDSKTANAQRPARPQRAERQKSTKSEADQGAVAVNPWLQGQAAADAESADGSATDGTTASNAAAALTAIEAQAAGSDAANAGMTAVPATGAAVDGLPPPTVDGDAAGSPSPLADILKLWSQLRSAQERPSTTAQSTPGQAASVSAPGTMALKQTAPPQTALSQAPLTGQGVPGLTVVVSTGAAASTANDATNAAAASAPPNQPSTVTPPAVSASSVAALLQMIGSGPGDADAPAARSASTTDPDGAAQTATLSTTPGGVAGLTSFLLSTMSAGGKDSDGHGADGSLKNLLTTTPPSTAQSGATSDAGLSALFAAAQSAVATPPAHTDSVAAGAGAPNPAPLALNSPGWETALSDRVHLLLHATTDGDINEARIQLHPSEMGSIQIHVRVGSDGADVRFAATHPDVRHALESSLPRLRELLASGGLSLGQAHVGSQLSQSFQQAHAQSPQGASVSGPVVGDTTESESAQPRPVRIASVSIVDDYA
jgi:flagellar hook-length control protein FliK